MSPLRPNETCGPRFIALIFTHLHTPLLPFLVGMAYVSIILRK